MLLYEIGDHDMCVRLHRDFHDWLEANVKNPHVGHELAMAFHDWIKENRFAINTNRFQASFGGHAATVLRSVLKDCPFIKQTKQAIRGVRSAQYRFQHLDRIRATKKQSLDNTRPPGLSLPYHVLPSTATSYFIPSDWLVYALGDGVVGVYRETSCLSWITSVTA